MNIKYRIYSLFFDKTRSSAFTINLRQVSVSLFVFLYVWGLVFDTYTEPFSALKHTPVGVDRYREVSSRSYGPVGSLWLGLASHRSMKFESWETGCRVNTSDTSLSWTLSPFWGVFGGPTAVLLEEAVVERCWHMGGCDWSANKV